jgi:hypothetical protein
MIRPLSSNVCWRLIDDVLTVTGLKVWTGFQRRQLVYDCRGFAACRCFGSLGFDHWLGVGCDRGLCGGR